MRNNSVSVLYWLAYAKVFERGPERGRRFNSLPYRFWRVSSGVVGYLVGLLGI